MEEQELWVRHIVKREDTVLSEEGGGEIEEVDVEERLQIRISSDVGNPVIGAGSARRGTMFVHGVAEKDTLRLLVMTKSMELHEVVKWVGQE